MLNNRLTSDEIVWQLKDSKAAFLISEEIFAEKREKDCLSNSKLPQVTKEMLVSSVSFVNRLSVQKQIWMKSVRLCILLEQLVIQKEYSKLTEIIGGVRQVLP